MKMYIRSLVMGRMKKKRKPCTEIAKILVSCQDWFGYKAKPKDHSGSCEQKPIPVRPSTTGSYLVFISTSQLSQVTAHHAVPVTWWCAQGDLCSLLLGPCGATQKPQPGREGTVLMVVTVMPRKTRYINNTGISRDEAVRGEWEILSQRGWEMLLQLRGMGMELRGKGCGVADGCVWHHTWEGA